MAQLLTLSRAARLVGVTRGALQKRIKTGELPTFEGKVAAEDLLRAYPQLRLEDASPLERLERIKEGAFARRLRERILPDPEVLVARLTHMGRELAQTRAQLEYHRRVVEALQAKLREYAAGAPAGGVAGLVGWLRDTLAPASEAEEPEALLVQDDFLRIMAAHVRIQPSGHEFFVEGSDTILDAALRSGLALDYGCSSGNCGLCRARVVSGAVKKVRPHDYLLSEAERAQGYLLMCSNTAVTDLVIEAREAGSAADIPLQKIATKVKTVQPLAADLRLLHLQTPRSNRLRFLAGQSVRLRLAGGAEAELPIASCPCDDRNLQFHVRRGTGAFPARVFAGLKGGDAVEIEGPKGELVLNDDSPRSLVFLAFDAGFAPIKSLVEHAMSLDVAETIHLYWVAAPGGQYLENQCRAWADALDNFRYTALEAPAAGNGSGEMAARLAADAIARDHPELAEFDIYVVGPAAAATAAEFLLLEAGVPRAQLRIGTTG